MERILIIQMSRLGDVVQTLPLIVRLRQAYPYAQIAILCQNTLAPIARASGLVEETIWFTDAHAAQMLQPDQLVDLKLIAEIVQAMPELGRGYDLVINLTHTLAAARLCECIPTQARLGRVNTYPNEKRVLGMWGKYLYAASQHRLFNTFNLVDMYVGMGGMTHAPVSSYLPVIPTAGTIAMRLLRENGYKGTGQLVALQIGANHMHRAWPVQSFAALAETLCASGSYEIIVLGTAPEEPLTAEFGRLFKRPFVSLTGKTGIMDLAAVLKQCDLLISNDTGTVHIAAAVGTQVLGLYFSTAYYSETAPYGQGNVILQPSRACAPCSKQTICDEILCRNDIEAPTAADTARAMLEGTSIPDVQGNVRTYRSRFLKNGMLVYTPLNEQVLTPAERTALIFRTMWEEALGINHDPKLLRNIIGDFPHANELDWLQWLQNCYSRAIVTTEDILRTFRKRPIDQGRIMALTNKLKSIEDGIHNHSDLPGIILQYHELEMMDTAYAQYPQMAEYLTAKYRHLSSILAGFDRGLKKLKKE